MSFYYSKFDYCSYSCECFILNLGLNPGWLDCPCINTLGYSTIPMVACCLNHLIGELKWTPINDPYTVCLLIWVAKLETSHTYVAYVTSHTYVAYVTSHTYVAYVTSHTYVAYVTSHLRPHECCTAIKQNKRGSCNQCDQIGQFIGFWVTI